MGWCSHLLYCCAFFLNFGVGFSDLVPVRTQAVLTSFP